MLTLFIGIGLIFAVFMIGAFLNLKASRRLEAMELDYQLPSTLLGTSAGLNNKRNCCGGCHGDDEF